MQLENNHFVNYLTSKGMWIKPIFILTKSLNNGFIISSSGELIGVFIGSAAPDHEGLIYAITH
jgi:hypothetical protein